MSNVNRLESNLYESFDRVKSDVVKVNADVAKISNAVTKQVERQDKVEKALSRLSEKISTLEISVATLAAKEPQKVVETKVVTAKAPKKKVYAKKKPKAYVASRTGKSFFPEESVQAKNIKRENKITFKSKEAFLKRGYKPAKMVTIKNK